MCTFSAFTVCRLALTCLAMAGLVGCALPLASESELDAQGDKEFQKIRAKTAATTDARERAYVVCVTNAIIRELEEPYRDKEWEIEVFDSEEINAFALPGGNIGVFTGIFKVAESQDQLAAVLGHEVAHVTRKHALQRYNREMTTQVGVIAGTAVLGGGRATADALSAAAMLGLSLPFSREQETDADTVGLQYMAAAGFDPRQSVPLWENMEKMNKLGPAEFFSTHPSPDTRIQDLIRQYPEALQRYNQAQAAGKKPRCQRP